MEIQKLEHVKQFGEKNTSIDRFPNKNGNYCPGNYRWATHREQSNNTRANRIITYKNKSKTMAEWARYLNVPYYILNSRINQQKWSEIKVLLTPHKKYL